MLLRHRRSLVTVAHAHLDMIDLGAMIVRMPKPKQSREHVRQLLEQRRVEHLTFNQLADRSGVPVHVLTHRATQDRKAKLIESAKAGGFIEVVASAGNRLPPSEDASGIEIVLPGGICARLDRQFDEAALKRLLSIVQC